MMTDIVAAAPSDVYDATKLKFIVESANKHNFKVEVVGIGNPFTFLSKFLWMKDYLNTLESNPIVCYTDAYDVFYSDSLETIKTKFLAFGADIVWSAERLYTHQFGSDKAFYDNLVNRPNHPYRYLNGGTFMGYKNSLLALVNNIEEALKETVFMNDLTSENWTLSKNYVDQTILSHYLAKNWNKHNIKVDYDCDIFYVASGDWSDINKHISKDFVLTATGKSPSIVHVPWRDMYEHVLLHLFNLKYCQPGDGVENKSYSWYNHSITFLTDGIMDAFGRGSFTQLDTHSFQANFGGKSHHIIFNTDYTESTSTRSTDGEIVQGKLL
jgi:hypothetical protein